MTRASLSLLVCTLALGLGLVSASVQSLNHARAAELDLLKRECDRIEAEIQVLEADTMRQRYALQYAYDAQRDDRLPER